MKERKERENPSGKRFSIPLPSTSSTDAFPFNSSHQWRRKKKERKERERECNRKKRRISREQSLRIEAAGATHCLYVFPPPSSSSLFLRQREFDSRKFGRSCMLVVSFFFPLLPSSCYIFGWHVDIWTHMDRRGIQSISDAKKYRQWTDLSSDPLEILSD